jgi:hypothetical protein
MPLPNSVARAPKLVPLVSLIQLSLLPIICLAAGATADGTRLNNKRFPRQETYEWNRILPPQMSRHPDIGSLGRSALCRDVRPPTQWTKDEEVPTSQNVYAWRRDITVFSTRHEECWTQIATAQRYAIQNVRKIRTTNAFDENRRIALTQMLNAEITAGLPSLSAKVKADLQRTEEITRSWKTTEDTEIQVTYPANKTLAVWALTETITISRVSTSIFTITTSKNEYKRIGPTENISTFEYIRKIYEDLASDEEMRRINPKVYGQQ